MAPFFSHVSIIEQQLDSSSGWEYRRTVWISPSGYTASLLRVYTPGHKISDHSLKSTVFIVTTAPDNPANRRVSANVIAPNHTTEARLGPTGYAATLSYSNDVFRADHHVK